MLKRKMIRKIIVASAALFALFLIYIIPNPSEDKLSVSENLEYQEPEIVTNTIYLMDTHQYLGRTAVVVNGKTPEEKVKELIEILIKGGTLENRIPSGFASILPSETKILSVQYQEGLIKIDFSKELLDISKELEEKMIEAIVYTVTSVDDIEKVIIYVEGDILTKLPKTGITLPSTLDRSFGINKTFDFTDTKEISQVTIYYVNKYNDDYYYVPVTKYLNDNRDKIKIIIDELASNHSYQTNLLSYVNHNTELLAATQENDILSLTFNSYIFNDVGTKDILEEVIYTICLSVKDNYDVKEVVFQSNEEEIYKTVLKELE